MITTTFKGKGNVNLPEKINKFTLERATVEDIFNINGYIAIVTNQPQTHYFRLIYYPLDKQDFVSQLNTLVTNTNAMNDFVYWTL